MNDDWNFKFQNHLKISNYKAQTSEILTETEMDDLFIVLSLTINMKILNVIGSVKVDPDFHLQKLTKKFHKSCLILKRIKNLIMV